MKLNPKRIKKKKKKTKKSAKKEAKQTDGNTTGGEIDLVGGGGGGDLISTQSEQTQETDGDDNLLNLAAGPTEVQQQGEADLFSLDVGSQPQGQPQQGGDLLGMDLIGGAGESQPPAQTNDGGGLLDLMGGGPVTTPQTTATDLVGGGQGQNGGAMDLLNLEGPGPVSQPQVLGGDAGGGDLLGGFGVPQGKIDAPQNNGGGLDLLGGSNSATQGFGGDLLGGTTATPTQSDGLDLFGGGLVGGDLLGTGETKKLTLVGHEDNSIRLMLDCKKTGYDTTDITVNFTNKTNSVLTGVKLMIAVTKHLQKELSPATSTVLNPKSSGEMTQVRKISSL